VIEDLTIRGFVKGGGPLAGTAAGIPVRRITKAGAREFPSVLLPSGAQLATEVGATRAAFGGLPTPRVEEQRRRQRFNLRQSPFEVQ